MIRQQSLMSAIKLGSNINNAVTFLTPIPELNENIELKLKPQVFERTSREFSILKLDLFEYRINQKIAEYISWEQDSIPIATDTFSAKWNTKFYHIFSPCSLLWKAVAKIYRRNRKCKVDMPKWKAQHWYPNLMNKANHNHTTIPGDLIQLQDPEKLHPLHQEMHIQQLVMIQRNYIHYTKRCTYKKS